MQSNYQARWVSKEQVPAIKRSGRLANSLLLDTLKGFILVEPTDGAADGNHILSPEEADYELQPVWFYGPKDEAAGGPPPAGAGAGRGVDGVSGALVSSPKCERGRPRSRFGLVQMALLRRCADPPLLPPRLARLVQQHVVDQQLRALRQPELQAVDPVALARPPFRVRREVHGRRRPGALLQSR